MLKEQWQKMSSFRKTYKIMKKSRYKSSIISIYGSCNILIKSNQLSAILDQFLIDQLYMTILTLLQRLVLTSKLWPIHPLKYHHHLNKGRIRV